MSDLKKKLLVTGGLGFIGSNLVHRLYGEYDIHVIDYDTTREANKLAEKWRDQGIKVFQNDIADDQIWGKIGPCGNIFHAAAQTAAEISRKQPCKDYKTNVIGTYNVAEFAAKNMANLIYCNSMRVYDPVQATTSVKSTGSVSEQCPAVYESDEWQPPFAFSKLTGEKILEIYANYANIRVINNRMSGVVGPGQKSSEVHGWVSHIVNCAKENINQTKKLFKIYGDGHQTRDLLYIDDFIDLVTQQLKDFGHFSDSNFTTYNVGGGKGNRTSIWQVINLLEENHQLSVPVDPEKYPEREGEPKHYASDISKIREKGWEPEITDPAYILSLLI